MLVDEFQDTDPVQWEIMRRAFGDGDATLVLIGDPKQAIYAFRGADVYAYLERRPQRRHAARRSTINWRSDQGLIDAYDALFGGAQLGHEGIVYRPRPRGRRQPRAAAARARRSTAPLRVRVVHRDEPSSQLTPQRATRRNARGARARSPTTSPPTSSALLSSTREIERPRARTAPSAARARAARATSRCSCARNRNAALVRDALDARRRPGRDQRRRQRLRHRRRRASGCGCSRRSSARRRPPRARRPR